MPRADDYDDDEPLPRRRFAREDEDDVGLRPRRSGTVTAVAIVAIVMGSLALACGVCIGIGGLFFESGRGFLQDLAKQAPGDPNIAKMNQDLARIPAWWIIASGVFDALRGFGLLFGGIGTLKRANWGRLLTLGMAVLGVVAGLAGVVMNFAIFGATEPQQIVSSIFPILIQAGFAVFAFVVLLNADNIREFDR